MLDIDTLVADCRAALVEDQPQLAIKEILERVVTQPAEIDAALGVATTGGFRSLHHSQDLTVLQFVWPPGVDLFPHDHRMWAAIAIYGGCEDNAFYRRTDGTRIQPAGGQLLETGDVALLGAEAIHSVSNPRNTHTAALHIYGGDFFGVPRSQWRPPTATEAPFDIDAVQRVLDAAEAASTRALPGG